MNGRTESGTERTKKPNPKTRGTKKDTSSREESLMRYSKAELINLHSSGRTYHKDEKELKNVKTSTAPSSIHSYRNETSNKCKQHPRSY